MPTLPDFCFKLFINNLQNFDYFLNCPNAFFVSQSGASCVTLRSYPSQQAALPLLMKKKKKKIDYEALHSSFMQIPLMKTEIARGLLDAGFRMGYELAGRAPEVVLEQILQMHPQLKTIPDLKERLYLAIYFVETPDPEPVKLKLSYWSNLD